MRLVIILLYMAVACAFESAFAAATASRWRAADELFTNNDVRFYGGDDGYTLTLNDVSGERCVLWLMGDSFVDANATKSTPRRKSRDGLPMPRNLLGVQRYSNDPTNATIRFYWSGENTVNSYFTTKNTNTWVWPNAGFQHLNDVYIFTYILRDKADPLFPFEVIGYQLVRIAAPRCATNASEWSRGVIYSELYAKHGGGELDGVVPGQALLQRGAFLYSYAVRQPRVYLSRYPLHRNKPFAVSSNTAQWWCVGGRWVTQRAVNNVTAPLQPVSGHGTSEYSVTWVAKHGLFVMIQCTGSDMYNQSVAISYAKSMQGPFSAPARVYRPAVQNATHQDFVYACKAHSELTASPSYSSPSTALVPSLTHFSLRGSGSSAAVTFIVTFASNSFNFKTLSDDLNLYFLKFVKLSI